MEKNETKRRTRSSDAKLLAFWETLTQGQQLRALRVLAVLSGYEVRPVYGGASGTGNPDADQWDPPHQPALTR